MYLNSGGNDEYSSNIDCDEDVLLFGNVAFSQLIKQVPCKEEKVAVMAREVKFESP